jgi:hypothetical protein
MIPSVLRLTDYDIAAAADYANQHMIDGESEALEGYSVNDQFTLGLFFEYVNQNIESNAQYMEAGIQLCRAQPAEDRLPCIEGLSGGHMKYGKPGVEYEKNLQFCAHELLSEDERSVCYKYFLTRLTNRYTPDTANAICDLVPEAYTTRYCRS